MTGPGVVNAPRKGRAYRVPVKSIAFVREGSFPAPHALPGAWAAEDLARSYLAGCVVENLILMPVDNQARARSVILLGRGGIAGLNVRVSEVLRCALLSGRPAFVLAHNHPSGDPTPSEEDRHFTRSLVAACKLVGLAMLDHVIVGDPQCSSWYAEPRLWGAE